MSTICADELFHDEGRGHGIEKPRLKAREAPVRAERVRERRTPITGGRRYEDFEARSTNLDDILGGQVFPRVF